MIVWFSGNSGSGKTTAAEFMAAELRGQGQPIVILDGDAMREVWPGLGFSHDDRWTQNVRVARLAKNLADQGIGVLVATICPFEELREACQEITGGHEWVYLDDRGQEPSEEFPYERPARYAI